MSSPRTRTANQARLVRCSAGCGTLVWLAGALPTTADLSYVCDRCVTARSAAEAESELALCGAVDEGTGAACTLRGEHSRHAHTGPDFEIQWVDRAEATS
jgi:hypothetical protein